MFSLFNKLKWYHFFLPRFFIISITFALSDQLPDCGISLNFPPNIDKIVKIPVCVGKNKLQPDTITKESIAFLTADNWRNLNFWNGMKLICHFFFCYLCIVSTVTMCFIWSHSRYKPACLYEHFIWWCAVVIKHQARIIMSCKSVKERDW